MVAKHDTSLKKVHRNNLQIRVLLKAISLLVGEQKLKCLLQIIMKTKPAIEEDKIYLSQETRNKLRKHKNFKTALMLITRANSLVGNTSMYKFYKITE